METIYPKEGHSPLAVQENLWIIGNYHFCHYLVRGSHASALIEAGVTATAEDVIIDLETLGMKPRYIVVTHPHVDHLMGIPALKEAFPESNIICGSGTNEFLGRETRKQAILRDDLFISEFLKKAPLRNTVPDLSESLFMKEGDRLDLGGITLVFLEIKGHSPGHIGVFIPEMGALFPSDALGFFMPSMGFFPTFFTGYADYAESLKRLDALGATTLGLPHHGLIRGEKVKEAFALSLLAASQIYAATYEDEEEKAVQKIYQKFYRDELKLYPPENIENCCRLLVRRVKEHKGGQGAHEGHCY